MQVIATKQNKDGSYDWCGTNNRRLLSRYKSVRTLLQYGIPTLWIQKGVRVEIFYGSIFKNASRTIFIKKGQRIVDIRG